MGEVIIFESMCLENVEHWVKENIPATGLLGNSHETHQFTTFNLQF
jgi:hypothetical protein